MTDTTVAILPPAPLYAMEIWSNPHDVAARFTTVFGATLPPMGRSTTCDGMTLIRFEPTVWLVDGDATPLEAVLGGDGSFTAIGGGIARVRIAGAGWRTLLMEGGVFDAESATFTTGCSAATIIDHVAVRLLVESESECLAFVPASYANALTRFWNDASLFNALSPGYGPAQSRDGVSASDFANSLARGK